MDGPPLGVIFNLALLLGVLDPGDSQTVPTDRGEPARSSIVCIVPFGRSLHPRRVRLDALLARDQPTCGIEASQLEGPVGKHPLHRPIECIMKSLPEPASGGALLDDAAQVVELQIGASAVGIDVGQRSPGKHDSHGQARQGGGKAGARALPASSGIRDIRAQPDPSPGLGSMRPAHPFMSPIDLPAVSIAEIDRGQCAMRIALDAQLPARCRKAQESPRGIELAHHATAIRQQLLDGPPEGIAHDPVHQSHGVMHGDEPALRVIGELGSRLHAHLIVQPLDRQQLSFQRAGFCIHQTLPASHALHALPIGRKA